MADKTLSQILEEHVAKIKTREDYDVLEREVEKLTRIVNSPILGEAPSSGLTEQEEECMTNLAKAFCAFNQLPIQRTHDLQEFVLGIHQLQRLVGVRHLRRKFPNYWLSMTEEKKMS